jgi:DNA-binding GntR family transcriptional regulator
MILSGRFKKGQRLIQEELAKSFDVSRTIIDKVLNQPIRLPGLILRLRSGQAPSNVSTEER